MQIIRNDLSPARQGHQNHWLRTTILISIFIFSCNSPVLAAHNDVKRAKTELSKINRKISQLESKLKKASDKKSLLNQEIKKTEKQIGKTVSELHQIRIQLNKQQLTINQIEDEINQLSIQLNHHQGALAKKVRTRYKMGENQPLKWLLNQENPNEISQLMTYYQYLIQSQSQAINKIKKLQNKLSQTQSIKIEALEKQKKLEQDVAKKQNNLKADQAYRIQLVDKIQKKIMSSQAVLAQFQKDKQNLAQLIKNLSRTSFVHAQKPFSRMKHKLPLPVHVKRNQINQLNQGLMFFSKEGSSVDSVYAGKVVFSDWLKGYGLLIIIDHGSGYLSLYAHNQSLFKRKGDEVEQGEQIATVGHSGGIKQNGLYFEIRHRGKAISPQHWLS